MGSENKHTMTADKNLVGSLSLELKAAKNQNQSADETNMPTDSSDNLEQSILSMQHLIAAAQAKRRAPNLQSSAPRGPSEAWDVFQGMVETLTRTKDSIGCAARLAIDHCAKHGLASEVVELLIQKMENEPSLHRRIDLFFLVDCITQLSHSQKGIAEASYIPAVQAMLPRLLNAAVPFGAKENRRHCLKVLSVWLDRKVLPEPLLRRYMDDIQVSVN